MTTWCHLPTILKQYRALWIAGLTALCVGIITTLLLSHAAFADQGINKTLSFQGRLASSSGAVVPDGYYNMQFTIYQDGDGVSAGDTTGSPAGVQKWSESYVNNNANGGVEVKNGYFSVNLGSIIPFGTSIDWNQDTLWLSMNIGGSAAACTTFGTAPCVGDGEMLPMKRITAAPYAINSGQLGGLTSDQYTQLGQGVQTDSSTNSSIFLNKTGTGNIIQLQQNAVDVFTVTNDGNITLGNTADKSITLSAADADTAGNSLTLSAGDGGSGTGSAGGTLVLNGGSAGGTNGNGGDVSIDSGAATGTGTGGTIALGGTNASAITLGSATNAAQITMTGPTTVKQATDSTDAFKVTASGGTNILTVDTTNGRVGIGSSAASNYALDVTGDINTSSQYRIAGTTVLTDSSLAFSGAASSTIASATSKNLELSSDTGVLIKTNTSTSASFNDSAVQIGDGSGSGSAVVLTLDKSATAPAGAALGSMYYDTTLGKVQCYQDNGWGVCGNRPDTFVTLSPEYSNAVMNGAGTGVITSDFCSDSLNINDGSGGQDTVCGTNETYNYYGWTSTETTAQTRSFYVTYQLPSSFKDFVSNSTSLMARTDSTDATVAYQVYKSHGNASLTACGASITASTGAQTSWQKSDASGTNDPSACTFAAGDSILIRIDITASNDASAYISNLNFAFSNE